MLDSQSLAKKKKPSLIPVDEIKISDLPKEEAVHTKESTPNLSIRIEKPISNERAVQDIIQVGDNGIATLSINDQGLLQIVVDSGLGEYTYLLPAKS